MSAEPQFFIRVDPRPSAVEKMCANLPVFKFQISNLKFLSESALIRVPPLF